MHKVYYKLIWYCFCILCSLVIFTLILNILFKISAGLVMLYVPIIGIFTSLVGAFLFNMKYKDIFNSFIIFISIFAINMFTLLSV